MAASEKDEILRDALETIVTELIEIEGVNKDHTGYIGLLRNNVFNRSITTFREGVGSFYEAMKTNDKRNDINSLHMRFMFRCVNSEAVLLAANNLTETVKENILTTPLEIEYDLCPQRNFVQLSKIDKILLLMHVYEDRIVIAVLAAVAQMKVQSKGKQK